MKKKLLSNNKWLLTTCLLVTLSVLQVRAAGAISVTSSAITLPKGSTSVSTGDWISAAGVTKAGTSWAYSDWAGDRTIGSYGSLTFSNAGDMNGADLLQFKKSGGNITTTISSPAGVDIEIGYKVANNYFTVSLTGAAANVTGSETSWNTMSISTTSTSATLSITKTSNGAGYVSYITITPKSAASCTTSPTVSAAGNSSITSSSATVSCSSGISSLGSAGCSISSYGFVIGSSANPSIGDDGVTKHEVGTSYTTTGTSFSKDLTGLTPGATYYVRSYATNGNGTAYGSGTSFTTKNRYNLTFKETDGTNNGSGTVVEDSTAIRITSAPSKDYYDLEGFYTTSELGTKIATAAGALQNGSGSGITVGGNAWTNGSSQWKRGAGETFYLNWTPKDYTITTTLSNCSWSSAISSPYTYDGSSDPITRTVNPSSGYTCPPNITVTMGGSTLTKGTDYTWSVNGTTGVGSFTLNKVITGAVAITITAEQLFTVTFNKGTGTCATSSLKGTNAAGVTLPTPTHHCDGWSFAGWTTGSLITTETGSAPATLYTGGSTYKPSADITLFAVYKHGDAKYHLVTTLPTGDDIAGNYMVVNTSNKKAMDAFVTSSYYLDKESISAITDNAINYADAGTYKHYTKWEVSYSSSAWHFYNTYTTKYLYNYVSSTNHYLGINSTKQNGYDLSLSSGYAVFTSKDDVGAHIYWDDSNSRFAATTGSTNNLHLYKEDPLVYFSNPSCCTPHDITKASSGSVTGGSFDVDKTSACENAEVTLSATPSSKQYVFNAWTVTETADPTNDITSTNVDGNTLTMPNFAVTVNASFSAISSIAVKTAPTKTTYCAGEYFDPTGLVVTATYANSATQDIPYAGNTSLFTFSPSTSTALTSSNTSVSITVYSKSTSQSITVNTLRTITLTGSGTVTGGSFTSDESSACVGATITLTPDADEHYSFTSWTIEKAGGGTVTPAGNTFEMPDDNVTVTATFTEDDYHYVTFKNDLTAVSGYDHKKTYDGTKPSAPTMTDVTDACDKTECTLFYGWIAEADIWDETLDDISDKTIYRRASDLPNVSGTDVTYHAVWAKGTAAPTINTTLIAKWDKQSLTASTAVKAKDKDGNTLNSVTMTPNIDMSTDGVYAKAKSSLGEYPLITIAGLDFSSYNAGVITFFARGSQKADVTVEYSTDNGSTYSSGHFSDGTIKNELGYSVTVPNTTTNVKIAYASNTGNFYFGTVRAYGKKTTSYNFTELTSSNTSGWSGADWDGYYLITATKDTKTYALRSDVMEGLYGYSEVSPSESVISNSDLGLIFKATYNSSTTNYAIQSVATQDYLTDNYEGFSEKYHLLETSATENVSIAYNDIQNASGAYVRWNSGRFGSYSSSTSPTLYKILTSYTKWRISCCEKHDITKDGSGTVTGGTFTVDKTSACEGATITLSVTSTSSGYNFDHWSVTGDDSSDEITVTDNQFTMPDEDVTVTAVFETAHTTTVTLNAQGGSGGTSSVTATVNLPMPEATMPTKSGYEFGGYFLATNGSGTQYYAANGSSAHDWDNGEDDTEVLYAKWTANGYTVTLNKEGATTQGTASVSVTYGANTNLTSAITCPTYTNKVFGGYWTTASGEGTQLIDGDGNWLPNVTSYTGTNKQWLYANNLELHARWSNVSYTNYRTTCGPEIEVTVSGTVRLTTYANCEVLTPSTSLITVSSDNWKSTVGNVKYLNFRFKDKVSGVTYTHTSSSDEGSTQKIANSEFRIYNASGNGGSYADGGYIEIPAGTTSATYNFRIAYKPTAGVYNTNDHYILEVEAMDNSATKKTITLEVLDLYGRTLPEEFAIAVKKDGKWYAMPNDLAGTEAASKAATAIPIVVDNSTTPTCALYAPENVLYKGAQYYDGPTVANRNRSGVRFTRNGSQWLQVSTVVGTNNMWLSATGGTDVQDWYLNSSDFNSYELKIDPRAGTGGYKDKKIGMFGSNFGFYATPTAYDIYLLPVENVLEEASVVEWGKNSVVLEVNAGSYKHVIARVGSTATGALSYAQTRTSVKNSDTKYHWTINLGNTIDLSTKKDQLLYFDWLDADGDVDGVSMVSVPWIIANSADMYTTDATKSHWETEVHVLPGVTLTADASEKFGSDAVTINQLEIYPGATVKVTSGTLTATNLVMRNGWTRAGTKKYDVARIYIASSANLTKSNAYADWYIDYDQYYPIGVPFPVSTSAITYKNSNSTASAGLKIRYYDGESRAANGQTGVGSSVNWKEYSPWPSTLDPSKGYAISAKRPTGKAFSIIRMPLTFTNDWTALGEQDHVSTTYKNKVTVTAWGKGTAEWYAMGWNFIANPYMSVFNGDDSGITGHIEKQQGGNIRYATIPSLDFTDYDQVNITEAALKPASAFFVQGTNPSGEEVAFTLSKIIPPSAPARYKNEEETPIPDQEAYIRLSHEGGKDQMGLIIGEDYTDAYEPNADLSKMIGDANTVKTYMRYTDMDMAYVAINQLLAREWIPVIVKIPTDGEYTYSLTSSSVVDHLEGIYLIDYSSNQITNLIEKDYVFTAQAGTISDRFAINAIVGERQTPTEIDVVGADKTSEGPIKFLYRDKVYIWHQGNIYDATGKKVKGGQK